MKAKMLRMHNTHETVDLLTDLIFFTFIEKKYLNLILVIGAQYVFTVKQIFFAYYNFYILVFYMKIVTFNCHLNHFVTKYF